MGGSVSSQINYGGGFFELNSGQRSVVMINKSRLDEHHYVVQNVGRTEVIAEVCFGTLKNWIKRNTSTSVKPGETKVLSINEKIDSGLFLTNMGKRKAVVHGKGGDLVEGVSSKNNSNFNYESLTKLFLFGVSRFVNSNLAIMALQELFILFWPVEKPNVWDEISDKINHLLDENTKTIITSLLSNEMKVYEEKFKCLIDEMEKKIKIDEHYMAIAYDLIGLEKKNQFCSIIKNHENFNLTIFPILINVYLLKIIFYLIGIKFSKNIGLEKNSILQIKKYASDVYENASDYMKNIEETALDNAYNTSEVSRIFNNMMTVRTFLAINGQEYLLILKRYLEDPVFKGEIHNPVISYSNFFGAPTPNLYAQATAEKVLPPLCPELINGRRNKLKNIEIYLWNSLLIFGAKLCFENGDEHTMGTRTSSINLIKVNEAKIFKIIAFGNGKVDGLQFFLSDREKCITVGTISSNIKHEFSLMDHHIPSFYMSNDSFKLKGQIANIVVSFQCCSVSHKLMDKNHSRSIL